MTQELKQELTLRITQANKTQLIVILYEMSLAYLEDGRSAHEAGNRTEFRDAIRKTRGCINELMASLHFEYELSVNFLQLYLYINKELARADVRNEVSPLENSIKVLSSLHKAYEELSKQDVSQPVMSNTQTVYAGLTYGKSNLNESLSNQGTDRGFRV